ncbi:MAG: phage regulatory CII family protein [Pseudomonadales bacterium]
MNHKPISDIDQAKYDLVHDHPGGAPALAPLVRMNPGTLCNKVNYTMDSHHLTVDEAIQIQLIRQDFRLFYAEARLFNQVAVNTPDFDNVSDMDLLEGWAAWHADTGETADLIRQVLNGATITRQHLAEIRREMFEDFQRELELLHRLEAMVDD